MRHFFLLTLSAVAFTAFPANVPAQDASEVNDSYEPIEEDDEQEVDEEDVVIGGALGDEGIGGDEVGTAAGDIIESTGDLREDTGEAMYYRSLAAEQFQQAIDEALDNRRESIKSYYEMRDLHDEESEYYGYDNEITPKLARKIAQKDAPDRLNSKQLDFKTGDIRWPKPLDAEVLKKYRKPIEDTFQKRYQSEEPYTKFDHYKVRRMTDLLEEALESIQDELLPAEYAGLTQYLESISYESRFNRKGERVDIDKDTEKPAAATVNSNRPSAEASSSQSGGAESDQTKK